MAILVLSPNGTYVTKTTLAVAATAADAAGKTVVVTSPQIVTTAIAWPTDRELRFEKGGYVTFTGAGSLTGLKEARPEWFGINTTPGTTDMTVPFQKAIDSGGAIELTGSTYLVGQLVPASNTHIVSKVGSVIKLTSTGAKPIFFDNATAGTKSNFYIEGVTLDGNMLGNSANYTNLTGGIWLFHWTNVTIKNVHVTNTYREGIQLADCDGVTIENYKFSASGAGTGSYPNLGYGIDLNAGTRRVYMKNIDIQQVVGSGIHLYTAVGVVADQVFIDAVTSTEGVGVTLTQAEDVVFNTLHISYAGRNSLELNASKNAVFNDVRLHRSTLRGVLFGDNSTGEYNDNITLNNVYITDSQGSNDVAGSYIKHVTFNDYYSNNAATKAASYSAVDATNTSIHFNRSTIHSSYLDRTYATGSNNYLADLDCYTDKTPGLVKSKYTYTMANAATKSFALFTNAGVDSTIQGKVRNWSVFPSAPSQMTLKEFLFTYVTSAIAVSPDVNVDGTFSKLMNFDMPAATTLRATNASGGDLLTTTWIEQVVN